MIQQLGERFRASAGGRSVGIDLIAIVRPESFITPKPSEARSSSISSNACDCAGVRSNVSGSKRFCDSIVRSVSLFRNLSKRIRSWRRADR
jgi:hypothetical protein